MHATLTIPIGATIGTITIPVIADNMFEPATETFTVNLETLTNATLAAPANQTATGTITDDDTQPTISISDIAASPLVAPLEGNAGPITPRPELAVTLSNPSYQNVTVSYATADGTATAPADYTAIGATPLFFAPGTTSLPVQFGVIGDVLDEADFDTILVNLTAPGNATILDAQGILNIADDDAMPTVTFQNPSTELQPEGNSGVTVKNIVIELSTPSGRPVTVPWQTVDNIAIFAPNATAGVDYVPANTSVVFPAGQTTRNLAVSVIGDLNTAEGNESIGLQLNQPDFATFPLTPPPPPIKQLLILEDDVPNIAPFATTDTLTVARDGSATINVRTNDFDANNDPLVVAGNTSAAHGSASCQFTGVCVYKPTPGYTGPDAFSYTLSDFVATATGTVNITVTNATPVANPDALVTGQGAPGAVNVLSNDTDPDGGALSIAAATNGVHGTVACGAGTCNYVPAGGFIGADQFTYTLKDNDGATAVGTVSVTVAKGKPLTITASANGAKSRKGAKNGYTITISNPNPGPVTLTSVSVCIPKGFSYTAGSVAGPLKKIPAKGACGAGKAKLTWAKKVSVPAKSFVTLRFKVNVGGALTTATVTVTAKAADSFAVIPLTKPAAPIKVTAPLSHGAK